ncbi:MAG: 2,3-bisphosphoglycerate-independent phosphoglycerate mutase [Planctomycetota bacterium]
MNASLELVEHGLFPRPKGPLLLVIMDGVGLGKESPENAVHVAKTPTLDRLFKKEKLFTRLHAHGTYVGLPSDEDMGNSEIGHNVLGAGRVFAQGAKLVNTAFETGQAFEGAPWRCVVERARSGGTVHFFGLYSDANVHSNTAHLNLMIERLKREGAKRVRVHPLLDGRDVGERTALDYILPAEERFKRLRGEGLDVCFASGGGRMNVTMDRYEADWRIVERGWNAHVHGKGRPFRSAEEAVRTFYAEGQVDQYADPFVVVDAKGEPVGKVRDGDAVILFNFRGDRAIEISKAFDCGDDFPHFDRGQRPEVFYAGMMEYDSDTHLPKNFLVHPPAIDRTISEYLCAHGVRSFAISETQKYGHVTYFWNGNRSGKVDEQLEEYCEIPSDRITFDKAPAMKARETTAKILEALDRGRFDFLRINLANGDMVGHTGVYEAALRAMEVVDECVGKMIAKASEVGATAVVTADHGNIDIMFTEKDGKRIPKTSHTLNPVPFTVIPAPDLPPLAIVPVASLGNVASTLLFLMGFEAPQDYLPRLVDLA